MTVEVNCTTIGNASRSPRGAPFLGALNLSLLLEDRPELFLNETPEILQILPEARKRLARRVYESSNFRHLANFSKPILNRCYAFTGLVNDGNHTLGEAVKPRMSGFNASRLYASATSE